MNIMIKKYKEKNKTALATAVMLPNNVFLYRNYCSSKDILKFEDLKLLAIGAENHTNLYKVREHHFAIFYLNMVLKTYAFFTDDYWVNYYLACEHAYIEDVKNGSINLSEIEFFNQQISIIDLLQNVIKKMSKT